MIQLQYKLLSSRIKEATKSKEGRVLVVDDDAAMRTILLSVLGKDFNVVAKRNGLEAMLWLSEGNIPDVIISDIMMPQLNGYDFIKNLRQSGIYSTIPVLVLSGHDAENIEEESLKIGADHYLSKPFDPKIVLDYALKAYLRSKFKRKSPLVHN